MSLKAQRTFESMGRAPLGKPLEDLKKAALSTNTQIVDMASGSSGALQTVTKAVAIYGKAAKDTMTVVQGLNNEGERVKQWAKGGNLQKVSIEVVAKDPNLEAVKSAQKELKNLIKAQRDYDAALKAGDSTD